MTMKSNMLFLLIVVAALSCSKNKSTAAIENFGVYYNRIIELRIQDQSGRDLLMPGQPGGFLENDINKTDEKGTPIVYNSKPGEPIITDSRAFTIEYNNDLQSGEKYYYIRLGLNFPPSNTKDLIANTYYKFGNNPIETFKVQYTKLPNSSAGTLGGGGMVKAKVWRNGTLIWELDKIEDIAKWFPPSVIIMQSK